MFGKMPHNPRIPFLACLRGIETDASTNKNKLDAEFLACLRGIETFVHPYAAALTQQFLACLRGIETQECGQVVDRDFSFQPA